MFWTQLHKCFHSLFSYKHLSEFLYVGEINVWSLEDIYVKVKVKIVSEITEQLSYEKRN